MNRRRFLQAGASAVAIAPASFLYAAGSTSQQIETAHGSLGLTDLKFSPEDLTIHGTVTNHTDRAWRWTTFQLRMRDAAGQPIPHDDRFDGYFYVQNLARNQTKPITDRKGRPARLLLRPTRQPAAIQAEFVHERSYFDSRYVFSMVSPKGAGDMAYEDEYLRLELKPAERLHLHLVNRARQSATIDWEKIEYIDLGGVKHRVIHGETPLMQKDKPQAVRVLDAGATLDTTLYPADMVSGSRIFEDWRLNPLLPLSQYAPHYKWRTFSLLVPWTAGTETRHYQFTVRIQDVVV